MSPISGAGREFGLDGQEERKIIGAMFALYVLIGTSPALRELAIFVPAYLNNVAAEWSSLYTILSHIAADFDRLSTLLGTGGEM